MRTFWVMLGRALLVGLAALGLFFAWFFYTVRWSGQARRAARNLATSYQLRVGMSAAEVRKLLGRANKVVSPAPASREPKPTAPQNPAHFMKNAMIWYYRTPYLSDGPVIVCLASDSTVTNIEYPKGEAPPVLLRK